MVMLALFAIAPAMMNLSCEAQGDFDGIKYFKVKFRDVAAKPRADVKLRDVSISDPQQAIAFLSVDYRTYAINGRMTPTGVFELFSKREREAVAWLRMVPVDNTNKLVFRATYDAVALGHIVVHDEVTGACVSSIDGGTPS